MEIKAVLFDLDGTLVDSIPDLTHGVNALIARYDKGPLSVETVSTMVEKGAEVLLKRAFAACDMYLADEKIASELEIYMQWMVDNGSRYSVIFPGVREGLVALKNAGIAVALVTNKPRKMTESLLAEKDIASFFDVVVAAGDAPTVKPHPGMLLLAAKRLGVNPESCAMVGDSGNDALAARNANMRPYLVASGYNEGEPIDQWAYKNGFTQPYAEIKGVFNDILNQSSE